MSWATEDWTTGLSGRVLQKVQELQAHNEKLNRERQQRQLQLDNSEAALHKQKQKYEEVRVELAAVQRELVGVREGAQAEGRARERLVQELQTKAAHVCALENQLESAKTLTQKLTQEVKRLEAELEKLQKDSLSGDSMLFSTPCWNMNSPWDPNGGKSGLRGECDTKAHHVRQQLLFGDSPKPSVGGVSSLFPQQPHKTPSLRCGVLQSEAQTHSSVFPWERDDTRSTPRGRPASSSSISSDVVVTDTDSQDNGIAGALRRERDDLCVRVSGLQKELQVEKERCRESESRLAQAQKELSIKEQNLTRSRDELARVQTRVTQEGDRAQAAEQRVKQLQEELKCQRQNAETSRCNAEQRRKEMEREHQKELLELQRERQSMEKQHQQESNRLNQEIQQARTAHNTLQAQYDKLALQKQAVERDLEGVQAQLKNTQADLTESQKRETQTLAKLTESLRESETLRVSLEQLKKKEKSLEAEVKRLTEELAEALKLIKELQAQLAAPPAPLVSQSFTPVTGDGLTPVLSVHYDRAPPYQHSTQKKRAPKLGRPRENDHPGTLTYPPDREPGEGIESEHVSELGSGDSVTLSIKEHEGSQHRAGRPGEIDMDSSITEQDTGIEDTDTDSYMSDSTSERMFKDEGFPQTDIHRDQTKNSTSSHQGQKQDSSSIKELKKENAALRDELRDAKQELERRLDDLETQRCAETEARTKLKQLSKKYSSQAEQHRAKAQEFKEKGSKLEAQLEQERKESARLKELVATLETEDVKRQEEGEREEEESKEENIRLKETLAEMERKEEQLEEEKEKMQKELEKLQSELLQEREDRAREREEEKKLLKNIELEGLKIAELQAELDRLRSSTGPEDKNVKGNMPLTYLQLGNQSNATDYVTADFENNVVSSPDAFFFCESVNLQNTLLSKETRMTSLITEYGTQIKSADHSQQLSEDSTSDRYLEGQEQNREGTDLDNVTILVLEVERLRAQRDREAERAKKSEKKLEVLQNQVTSQTQQLTLAFEKQSKHIQDLLRELQERDDALQRQGKELQNCREEIASFKVNIHMVKSNPEQSVEEFEESSCDLVSSKHTADTLEMVIEEASNTRKDKPLQSGCRESQPGSWNAELDKSHMSEVNINTKELKSLHTSDKHGRDSACLIENTKASEPLESPTAAQQGRDHVVENNTENAESYTTSSRKIREESHISEFPQCLTEYPTDDVRKLKRVINELHEAQNELSLLKAKHDQLTLQLQEVSKEEFLFLKQENEQLILKLELKTKETCASQITLAQNESSHLTNAKAENPAAVNQDQHHAGNSSRLREAVGLGGSSRDGSREKSGESEDETAHTHSLQEQVQALQSQLQLLTEQNREQAEELQLWRLSASSLGESMDDHGNGSPIMLVREDQLVLPCSPTGLHMYSQQSSIGEYRDLSQPNDFSALETGQDERDKKLASQNTAEKFQPVLKAKELIANNDCTRINVDDQHKVDITALDVYSTFPVSSSGMEKSGDKYDSAHTVKSRGPREEAPGAVLLSLEEQSDENTFTTKVQEDCCAIAKSETKAIDPKLNSEPSNCSDSLKPCLNRDEAVTPTLRLNTLGSTTDQQNEHPAALGRQTDNSQRQDNVVIKFLATDQGSRSEAVKVAGNADHADTKEVKNVSTQTEECSEWAVEEVGRFIAPKERMILMHASTQTQVEEVNQPEDVDIESVASPSSSPVPPPETEKVLFSGAFPIPANPAHLAERIRRNRSRMSAAYDDTEYEPYGLPEVVMKGFADIPSGPACPYVLRRGLLGTDSLPVSLREPLGEPEEDIDP
ncbi:centromere protein F isoform X2 [Pygocentrus nattereri]|nr:centromere protein F isoform X2 [Pygocentrus nattereri]